MKAKPNKTVKKKITVKDLKNLKKNKGGIMTTRTEPEKENTRQWIEED